MRPNRLREQFAAGKPAVAGWLSFDSRFATELMGHAGFDAVVVDMQHGPYHIESAIAMMQALSATPKPRWREAPLADALDRILQAARAAGRRSGNFCTSMEMSGDMRRAGYDLIVPGFDSMYLSAAARDWAAAAREG